MLVGRAESSIARLEGTAAIAALEKFDVGPAMPAFFCTSSADGHCEKFVTELSARPTSDVRRESEYHRGVGSGKTARPDLWRGVR